MIIETVMSSDSLANLRLLKGNRFQFLCQMNSRDLDNTDSVHVATDGPSVQLVSDDNNEMDAGYFEVRIPDENYPRKCLEEGWVFLQKRNQKIKNIYVVRTTYKNKWNSEDVYFDHLCERGIVFELEDSCIYFSFYVPFNFLFDTTYLNSIDELEVPSRLGILGEALEGSYEYKLVNIGDLMEAK